MVQYEEPSTVRRSDSKAGSPKGDLMVSEFSYIKL